jgi:predicted RNA-binding Zn-ribbon protein involved in translation (DUF1610 family)
VKILLIDVETSPNLAWSFELRNAFISIDQIVDPSRVICFAAQWYGEDEVEFRSEFHDGRGFMLDRLHSLLDSADVLLHFNGKKFDEKRINVEFFRAGLTPPAPYQRIDLWRVVSRRFDFPSSKLAWVLKEANLPGKVETGGFNLWKGCLDGDALSWRTMKSYNIQDVRAMVPLYEQLRPWITDHPSYANYSDRFCCTNCGSEDVQKRGFARTNQSTYQRYRCNACGSWARDTRRVSGASITQVAA